MVEWIDFKAVKGAVSIEMVLDHYGVRLRKVNKYQLRGKCPLPTHTSGESSKPDRESFAVNRGKNAWVRQSQSCKAARGGRAGGGVLDFVAAMEQCSIREAALKLADWFGIETSTGPPTKKAAAAKKKKLVAGKQPASDNQRSVSEPASEQNPPLKFKLKSINLAHPYLKHRGPKKETVEHFGVGYFSGKGLMQGRVVIPIHNQGGELVAYAGRAIDEETEPKYKLPAGFKKSVELFNLHRAVKAGEGRAVIVVEGHFDYMKVWQSGFPAVIGLMGTTLSEAQKNLLTEHFDQVVLMLDGDKPGREAAGVIAGQLIRDVFVRVVTLDSDQQPDRLSSAAIRDLLGFLL